MDLKYKTCKACRVGAPTIKTEYLPNYLKSVDSAWRIFDNDTKIKRDFVFKDFKQAVDFVNKVAKIAEDEGHHPDIHLHDYKKVTVTLWTHKIGGLHENDFILASKIDEIK